MTEVHRYSVVKMLSEGGNRISYDPYGPEVVMASAYDQLKTDNERLKADLKKVDTDRKACWAEFKVQGRQLDQLKAENEALRKDAERWRFFSVLANDLQAFPHAWGKMTPEKMDAMCDLAMADAAMGKGEQL